MTDLVKEPVIFVSQIGSVLQEVKAKLEADPQYAVESVESAIDLTAKLDQHGPSLLIFHAQKQDVVNRQIAMMKSIHDRIKTQNARIIVLASQIPDALLDLYERMGCRDILKEPVIAKNLLFKIKKLSAALAQRRKMGQLPPEEAKLLADPQKRNATDKIRTKIGAILTRKGEKLQPLRIEESRDHDNLMIATLFLLSELRYEDKKSAQEIASTLAEYLKQFIKECEVEILKPGANEKKWIVLASSDPANPNREVESDQLSSLVTLGTATIGQVTRGAVLFRGSGAKNVPESFAKRLASALEPIFSF